MTQMPSVPVLLRADHIDDQPRDFVEQHGVIRQEFAHLTQDSGNVSWLVDIGGEDVFVKTAGLDRPPPPGAPTPYFDHRGRVALLRNAVEIARSCAHPALPALLNVIESPSGPMLVYRAAVGELVGVASDRRDDPQSPYQRFARLEPALQLPILDTLIEVNRSLAAAGWIAGDLYDGCLIVDFPGLPTHTPTDPAVRIIDLDSYRRGPSRNDMGRMFGSTRFMAPEEFRLGARLDEATTVFTLGRLVRHFMIEVVPDRSVDDQLLAVADRATQPEPADRFATVAELTDAWQRARAAR